MTIAFALLAACGSSGDPLLDEFNAIDEELTISYVRPVLAAEMEAAGSLCGITHVSASGRCADVIEVIANASPALDPLIERLTSLRAEFPPHYTHENIVILDRYTSAIQALRQSDLVLLEAVELADNELWKEGWDLRDEARAKVQEYIDATIDALDPDRD